MALNLQQLLHRQLQLTEMLARQQGLKSAQATPQRGQPLPMRQKHSGSQDLMTLPPPDLSDADGNMFYRPLYETAGPFGGFFQDGTLRQAFMNLVVYPTDGIGADIPTRANNVLDDKYGFFLRYSVAPDSNSSEGDVCDPAIPLTEDYDFLKMGTEYGRLMHSVKTMDVTNLILRAQQRQYDDFYIQGQWRGVSDRADISTFNDATGNLNTDLIVASALRRKLANLGGYFQKTILDWAWQGDPANTPGGKQIIQPYGLYRLINGNYSTSGLPVTTTSHVGGPSAARLTNALSSIVVNVDGKAIGDGTFSMWQTLRTVEQLLYQRAKNTGMLPVNWRIYMTTPLWNQMVEHLACEMVVDGCVIPGDGVDKVLNMNDGGVALYNLTAREQIRQSQSLTLNGRTYPVVLDDTMPYDTVSDDQGNFMGYKSDIFFIPFTVMGGEQVLYWEYVDFSQIYAALQPLSDRALDAKGWTDNGYYWHIITTLRQCVEMQTEMRPRLIFRAPQLAARIDNVTAMETYQYPMWSDGGGANSPAGWLVPPA